MKKLLIIMIIPFSIIAYMIYNRAISYDECIIKCEIQEKKYKEKYGDNGSETWCQLKCDHFSTRGK